MDSPKTAEYRHSDSDAEVGQLMASKEVEPSPEVAENTGDHQAEADDRDMDEEEDGAGLFGSGSENEHSEGDGKMKQLDDEELDSDDDEGGRQRAVTDKSRSAVEDTEEVDKRVMDSHLGRHPIPESHKGEVHILKFPPFLGLEPTAFNPKTFQLPQTDHHSNSSPTFSQFRVATNTLRWRRSPKNPTKLEANSRILVWSDGSMTLQLANNPTAQFELPAKPLVPPSMLSAKPLPTSKYGGRSTHQKYDPRLDSHTYLTAPHESAGLLRVTNHITSSLTVLPSSDINDEALTKLQQSVAAATRGSRTNADGSLNLITVTEDPELAKKRAELAERDRFRQQKKLQMSIMRETERANRSLARNGLVKGAAGALSVGALEDDDARAPTKARAQRPGARKRGTRGKDSDDDDDLPRGRTREDEYDKTDDFLVDSDEEDEEFEGDGEDEDEEEAVDEGSEDDEVPQKSRSPKRQRPEENGGTKQETPTGSRSKRRRVIEEDEDDE